MNEADARIARVGYAEAERQLGEIRSKKTRPSSFDVRAVLVELGIDAKRVDIVQWCKELNLPLEDGETEVTKKIVVKP